MDPSARPSRNPSDALSLQRSQRVWHALAAGLVLAATAASLWLFAAVEPSAYYAVGMLILAGLACWLLAQTAYSPMPIRVPALTLLLLLLLLLGVVQVAPLPASWTCRVNRLSPLVQESLERVSALYDRQTPLGEDDVAASASGIPSSSSLHHSSLIPPPSPFHSSLPLSVSPLSTRIAITLFSFYLAAFLVTANCLHSWRGIRLASRFLVISGTILAVVGIAHKFSGSPELLWVHLPRYRGDAFGPFSNRNHFAAHMNMLFGLTLGLLLSSGRLREMWCQEYWRGRFIYLTTSRASKIGLLLFVLVVVGGSTFLSLSRGGMLSLVASLAALVLFAAYGSRRDLLPRRLVLSLFLLLAIGIAWLGWKPILDRLATLAPLLQNLRSDGRIISTWDTLRLFLHSPVVGCGFGSFEYAFPLFQHLPPDQWRFLHAHNDWAQLFAEGGLAGGLLFLTAIVVFVRYAREQARTAPATAVLFTLGLMVGLLAIGLHSVVDYSLHKPANALFLSVLAGLLVAALNLQNRGEETWELTADWDSAPEPAKPATSPVKLRLLYALVLLVAVIHAANQAASLRNGMAVSRFEYFRRLYQKTSSTDMREQAVFEASAEARAIGRCYGVEPRFYREIAAACFGWATDRALSDDTRLQAAHDSLAYARTAVIASPVDFLSWYWLARAEALHGHWDKAILCTERARSLVMPGKDIELFRGE